MSNPVGRPLKFKSAKELQEKIEDYFNYCLPHPEQETYYEHFQKEEEYKIKGKIKKRLVTDYDRKPTKKTRWVVSSPKTPTITGLAVHLDTSRQTLINLEEKDEFFDTIKKAKDLIENHWEGLLEGNNVTGVIFNLKNNYAWRDRTETDLTSGGERINPYADLTPAELRKLAKGKKASGKK